MPIDTIKSNNISDTDFTIINKINHLSNTDKAKAEGYIDRFNDK
ncbi:MAG: hypothetical protein ACK5HL_03065 [Bacilli bacterium]